MKKLGNSQHKAVAPIIATLLMVAIAVVGGILIFVFTQGFFADEQVVGQTVDELRIIGYDTSDSRSLTWHDGDLSVNVNDDENPDNKLDDGDMVLIYAENIGDSPLSVESVTIFEQRHSFDPDDGGSDCYSDQNSPVGVIATGSFGVSYDNIICSSSSLVDPNTEFTIVLVYEEDGSGEVKMGKKLPIKVTTSQGQTFLLNAINGAQRGA